MEELDTFAERIGEMNLSQSDMAVAFIWYRDHKKQGAVVAIRDLSHSLHNLGLCSAVNVSRLLGQLGKHPDVVRGQFSGTYRLKAASRSRLDDIYAPLLGKLRQRESDSILQRTLFANRRASWQKLVVEINGCYDYGFYDGAAVLCRRLVETLIVAAFIKAGFEQEIRNEKDENKMMAGLISLLQSGKYVKISRSAKPGLEPIKVAGDVGAHSSHHITSKPDIDTISTHIRVVVSELLGIIDGD